jgi:plastocyanin
VKIAALAAVLLLTGCGAPAPMSSPPADALIVTAAGEAFTSTSVSAPAGTDLTIYFEITDSSQHDLHLWDGDTSLGSTEIFGGPSAMTLDVPALAPGNYRITCDIHPGMLATLVAD